MLVGRRRDHEDVVRAALLGHNACSRHLGAGHAEIGVPALHRVDHLRGVHHRQGHADLRMHLQEVAEQPREDVLPRCRARRQAKPPGDAPGHALDRVARLVDLGEQLTSVGQEYPAGLRELDAPIPALQQGRAQVGFEGLYLHGHRGLRHSQHASGVREGLVLHHRHERAYVRDVHPVTSRPSHIPTC